MKKYDTILFDLDGTLTDPGEGITNSVAYALQKLGEPKAPYAVLCRFIGPPLLDAFAEFCGFSAEKSRIAVKYYREYFRERGIFENKPYDGVEDMLAALRADGRRLIVATSKPEFFAECILKHFGLQEYFSFVAGAAMDETRTRKDEVLAYALDACGITCAADAVMVGDRKHDILGAQAHGLFSVGVLYGYGSRAELTEAGADLIVPTVASLRAALLDKSGT